MFEMWSAGGKAYGAFATTWARVTTSPRAAGAKKRVPPSTYLIRPNPLRIIDFFVLVA
jgi:hypothetical protein